MKLFRDLEASEVADFKKWARDNYKPNDPIKGIWHPIIQDECVQMNSEHRLALSDIVKTDIDHDLDKMAEGSD